MHLKTAACAAAAALLHAGAVGAQPADSTRLSVPRPAPGMELLAAPADGPAYLHLRSQARRLMSQRLYAQAEPLLDEVARAYPRDGQNWMRLGHTRAALGRHREAAEAFERAGPLLGWHYGMPGDPGVFAATSRMAAGDRRGALDLLRRLVFQERSIRRQGLWDVPALQPLRDEPEFREIAGRPDVSGLSRDEGWRLDVDYLYEETKRVNPDYHAAPFPAEVTRRYEQLKRDVPTLSDEEIFVRMNHMLAPLRQGHTHLFITPDARFLPVRLYAFPEGLFIIEAAPEHASLIGSRVVAFEEMPTEEAVRRMGEARNRDGEMEVMWSVSTLASTYYLKGLGAIRETAAVTVTLQAPGGETRRVTLPTRATAPAGRQDRMVPPPGAAPPLFLSRMDQKHWEQALPEHDALYVQMNNVSDDPDETLQAFGQRLRTVLAEQNPANLIVDLRHNNGGSTNLYTEFLRTVTAFSAQPGKRVYVMIGRRTFSATANLITDLERLAFPFFVGEASGECCHLNGDPSFVTLPYSGIQGEVTGMKWNLSGTVFDARREISPQIPVQLTAEAYFAGRDPALEAIFQVIHAGG
ncbi:hypothetical protein [Longimicrobium sp.]|uniref:hypothetical protein n=1 Tax=Longimicrobium sp. TaxID=2029185 RepID=UPI003B3B0F48